MHLVSLVLSGDLQHLLVLVSAAEVRTILCSGINVVSRDMTIQVEAGIRIISQGHDSLPYRNCEARREMIGYRCWFYRP